MTTSSILTLSSKIQPWQIFPAGRVFLSVIFNAISKLFSPEILITPTPPVPSGVEIAAIVSNSCKIFI